jgi:hypothetical protein
LRKFGGQRSCAHPRPFPCNIAARLNATGTNGLSSASRLRRHACGTATASGSDGDRAQEPHARRKPQRSQKQRQGLAAAACGALGSRRQTATAPPPHPDISLTLSAFAESSHESANGKKTAKRPKGTDPILTLPPKPP